MESLPVNLGIRSDGQVTWNGSPIDQKTMAAYFDNAAQTDFIITAGATTPYGKVAAVISELQKRHIERIMCVVPD